MAVAKTTKSDLNAQLQNPLSESKLKKTSKDELQKMVDAQKAEVPEPVKTEIVTVGGQPRSENTPEVLKDKTDKENAQLEYEHNLKVKAMDFQASLAKKQGNMIQGLLQDFEYRCVDIEVQEDIHDGYTVVTKKIECVLDHQSKVAFVIGDGELVLGADPAMYKSLQKPLSVPKPKRGSNGSTEITDFIMQTLGCSEEHYELKELAEMMATKFGGTVSSYQTRLTDSKNPKYSKLPKGVLLVTQKIGNQKVLLMDTDSRVDRATCSYHKDHPWAKEDALAEEEVMAESIAQEEVEEAVTA